MNIRSLRKSSKILNPSNSVFIIHFLVSYHWSFQICIQHHIMRCREKNLHLKIFQHLKKIAVLTKNTITRPAYLTNEYSTLKEKFEDSESIQFCYFNPFLCIIPLELSDLYPASHYEMSRLNFKPEDFPSFTKIWNIFFSMNKFDILYVSKNDDFLKPFLKLLPKSTKRKFF